MNILLLIWQLPQTLLGLLVLAIVKLTDETLIIQGSLSQYICYTKHRNGVSFGPIIIVWKGYSQKTIGHELGHSIQSKLLGWLYLPVVGLPSITMNILTRMKILRNENYFKRFPENWADKLGGVDR